MARAHTTIVRSSGWHALRTGAWLGWQIDSNWAHPSVFAIYALLRPLALTGILAVMYASVHGGDFESPVFTYIFLGNAFYIYVGAVTSGMGWAVVQDRENYRTLKSIYSAPVAVPFYLIGHGLARFATASVSVLVILCVGLTTLGVGITLHEVNWLLLGAALGLGVIALALMGLGIAGLMLLTGTESWALGDLLAGALFLFSGAVFPIDALPAALRPVGLLLPVTYWLELIRRAIVPVAYPSATFGAWSNQFLFAVLAAVTGVLAVCMVGWFRFCETLARERGLLDRTSSY